MHEKDGNSPVPNTTVFPLSLPALEWLLESGSLSPSPRSPIAFLLKQPLRTSLEERIAAGKEVVQKGLLRGISSATARTDRSAQLLGTALEILAQPTSRIRVTVITPSDQPLLITLFSAGEKVTLGYFDSRALHVAEPFGIRELVQNLERNVDSGPQIGPARVLIWASQIRLSTFIWGGCDKRATEAIRRSDALSALSRAKFNPEDASAIITCLLKTGVIEESNDWLVLQSVYRNCMDLVWSGHLFEIERTTLRDNVSPDDQRDASKRLLFVGPPGRRLLCTHLTVSAPKQAPASPKSTQPADSRFERLVAFAHLPNVTLKAWIAGLMDGTAEQVLAQNPLVEDHPTNEPSVLTTQTVTSTSDLLASASNLPVVKCPKCSAISEPGSLFCSECGGDLGASIRAKSTAPPVPRCPKCAEPVESASTFCGNCGQRLAASTNENDACRECGISLSDDDMFCPNCGRRVREEEATQQ